MVLTMRRYPLALAALGAVLLAPVAGFTIGDTLRPDASSASTEVALPSATTTTLAPTTTTAAAPSAAPVEAPVTAVEVPEPPEAPAPPQSAPEATTPTTAATVPPPVRVTAPPPTAPEPSTPWDTDPSWCLEPDAITLDLPGGGMRCALTDGTWYDWYPG